MTFEPSADRLLPELTQREEIVLLARTLWREGYNDHLAGHITINQHDGTLLCNPWMLLWNEFRASDVIRIDLEGNVLEGDWPVPPGIPLHLQLHKMRPGVEVAMHNHPLYGTVWADMQEAPAAMDQSSSLGGGELVLVDEYDGAVNNPDSARHAIEKMGDAEIALLAGHGVFVLGNSVRGRSPARRRPRAALPARLARAGRRRQRPQPPSAGLRRPHAPVRRRQLPGVLGGHGAPGAAPGSLVAGAGRPALGRRRGPAPPHGASVASSCIF